MNRRVAGVAFGLLLMTACAGTDAGQYTPMPYGEADGVWSVLGKTFINLPVWGAELALVAAVTVFCAWLQAGAPIR